MGTTALVSVVNNMRSINFSTNKENTVTVTLELDVPVLKMDRVMSDEDIKELRKKQDARTRDILGSFSTRIVTSLQRRMNACLTNMLNHAGKLYSPCEGIIQWDRKDGSHNYFNGPSFNAMLDCVKALNMGCYGDVLKNNHWIDQILKALLLDPVEFQDHSDAGGFRYSELISLLCECHLFGQR